MSYFTTIEQDLHYPCSRDVSDLGIGIVGASHIVDHKHCPAYAKHGLPVVGVYDVNATAATALAAKHSIPKVYPSLDALLADPAIKIIDCAIPSDGRLPIIQAAAAAGKHILMHKPFAYTAAEGQQFIDAAQGVTIAVNQNARWAPTYAAATQLIRSGAIGTPYWVHHQLLSGFDWLGGKEWHLAMKRFQIHQYGIHHFDILSVWLGRQPSAVFTNTTRRPDQLYQGDMMSSVVCHYDDHLQAYLQETNALHPKRPWATHFEIHGTEGCIVSKNLDTISIYNDHTGEEGEHHDFIINWFPDAFAYPMYELMVAIQDRVEPEHSAAKTLANLISIDAAYQSAETGQLVHIPSTISSENTEPTHAVVTA